MGLGFKVITIDELLSMLDKYDHKELHLHHTWKPVGSQYNGLNGIALQESMKRSHLAKGWQDIGQHVTLLPDGQFVTGRDFSLDPASITGYNKDAFACEMLGNFDTPGTGEKNDLGYDLLVGRQKESALKLAAYFDKKNKYVRFHRENAPKTCPGTSIDKVKFMQEVKATYTTATKKYYVVTNYLPATKDGVEILSVYNEYFKDFGIERLYLRHNEKGIWIETQYIPKEKAEELAKLLKFDQILWAVMEV